MQTSKKNTDTCTTLSIAENLIRGNPEVEMKNKTVMTQL